MKKSKKSKDEELLVFKKGDSIREISRKLYASEIFLDNIREIGGKNAKE